MNDKVTAIVPAAGFGKRFGSGTNKSFHVLLNKPLFVWGLEVFEEIEEITEVIPVIKEHEMEQAAELFKKYKLSKIRRIAPGGEERQDSVYHGLRLIEGKTDVVLIHDGARPLIDKATVVRALNSLDGVDGVVVGVPVIDTIKETENQIVKKTLRREGLWAAQTPQVFVCDSVVKAYKKAMEEKFYSTDDSALVERINGRIKIVMGSYENIKITTPEDVRLAELVLGKRMKG